MSARPHFYLSPAIALALSSSALADVTPNEVWDGMEAYMQGFGYSVTATETLDGDTLTVSDIIYTVPLPEEEGGGEVIMTMPSLTFRGMGDGTVQVSMPETVPMKIQVGPDGALFDGTINLTQQGLAITVSGDADNMQYDYSANRVGMALGDMTVEGTPIPPDIAKFVMMMSGMSGMATVTAGDVRNIDQTVSATAVTYDFGFTDPQSGDTGNFTGSMANFASTSTATLPTVFDPEDMAANFAAGFGVSGDFGYENGQTQFAITENDMTTQGATGSAKATFGVVMNRDALSYSVASDGVTFNIVGGEIPFPLDLTMDRLATNFSLPLNQEKVGEFGLGMQIVNFALPDMLWAIGDPGGVLPRDPATITFDITGMARPLADIFDPVAMARFDEDELPAELESMTLSDLRVSAAGAELTGAGDFSFDNSDTQTFDGMPRPEGAINLRLTGANALIDKLIEMGIVQQEDAMGARMMMSMFTIPDGDDVLTSTLEVNEQGHVLANGQRIQ